MVVLVEAKPRTPPSTGTAKTFHARGVQVREIDLSDEQNTTTAGDDGSTSDDVTTNVGVDDTQAAPETGEETTTTPDDGDGDNAGTDWEKRISALNHESAKFRTQRNEAQAKLAEREEAYNDLVSKLAKLAGNGDEDVSPEEALNQARQERDELAARLRSISVERDITTAANSVGLNTKLAVTLLKGEGKLAELNPESDNYNAQVAELVEGLKKDYPEAVTQAVSKSSGHPANSRGTDPKITREQLENMSAEEIYKAQAEGKLDHLLR